MFWSASFYWSNCPAYSSGILNIEFRNRALHSPAYTQQGSHRRVSCGCIALCDVAAHNVVRFIVQLTPNSARHKHWSLFPKSEVEPLICQQRLCLLGACRRSAESAGTTLVIWRQGCTEYLEVRCFVAKVYVNDRRFTYSSARARLYLSTNSIEMLLATYYLLLLSCSNFADERTKKGRPQFKRCKRAGVLCSRE